ncbi:MAG: hypothetical protein FWG03_04830 [Clostridiales bacterium]|nr:hypothetical protein [Clostridiales bacterium]
MKKQRGSKFTIFLVLLGLIIIIALVACDDDSPDGDGAGTSGAGSSLWDKPPVKEPSFQTVTPGFSSDDPNIKMIEINQSLSYGFDTDTGQFYTMENFVAGKETAVFISMAAPPSPDFEAVLTIEKDGEVVAELLPADMPDQNTLLFQPKNMADVNHWEQGAYTFTLTLDGGRAVRTTNFFESIKMRVLAVPIVGYYSGRVHSCMGDWQNGAQMISATYPIARADIDYVLGPELDLSSRKYDLDDEDGQYNVWKALTDLQTPGKDYTIIVGFIRENAGDGVLLGYTYGLPASIVVESSTDMLATVPHEVAHCYNIGDEYEGGSLNLTANSPPYGMSGEDIMSGKKVTAKKEAVVSGLKMGVNGTGSMIYPQQRAYWAEGRRILGPTSSYMGAGMDADSYEMWTSSEIWNHLFGAFTGYSSQAGTVSGGGSGGGSGGSGGGGSGGSGGGGSGGSGGYDDDYDDDYYDDDGYDGGGSGGGNGYYYDEDDYWGRCPNCCADIYDPDIYAECYDCGELTFVETNSFVCDYCGARGEFEEDYAWIECSNCWDCIWFGAFMDHNFGKAQMGKVAAPMKLIEITGYIGGDGAFVPSPWYVYEGDPSEVTQGKSGGYAVCIYDGKGKQVSVANFDPGTHGQFTTTEGSSFAPLSKVPVDVVLKFPESAAKIVLKQGEQTLYSKDISKNAPEVSFTGLSDYQKLSDKVRLTWDASDADGDELYFELWYCPDEENYYNLAADITGAYFDADLSSYPGTDEGYFYIFATDGVLTGEAGSPWVKVPYKAPEIISTQKGTPESKITEEICFAVDIYDMQDGWLWDEEVVWTLDGKEFMIGDFLWVWPYELAPGTHTFTCSATNSAGLSSAKDFSFTIIDDESDLPDDWSRGDIVDALSNGFVLPLNRIDAPVTRGQFAVLMANLYDAVTEDDDPFPDYREGVVTDCGRDDYDQFLMVHLGVMEAKGGRFEPAKALTEEEAALIMYRVCALADPDYFDADFDGDEMVGFYYDIGVFDEDGPGAYEAAGKLSNRLALVRLSRLYNDVFE